MHHHLDFKPQYSALKIKTKCSRAVYILVTTFLLRVLKNELHVGTVVQNVEVFGLINAKVTQVNSTLYFI